MIEESYSCPLCGRKASVNRLATTDFIHCENCQAHFKLSDIICPSCLQQCSLLPYEEAEWNDSLSFYCENCISLSSFYLCLFLKSSKKEKCKECCGIGISFSETDSYRYRLCTESVFLHISSFQFKIGRKFLGDTEKLKILKSVIKDRKWPSDLTIRADFCILWPDNKNDKGE